MVSSLWMTVDRPGLLQVDPQRVGQRPQRQQVRVKDSLQRFAGSPLEAPQPIRKGHQDRPAQPAIHGEQPQQERIPQPPAPKDMRRLPSRA